MVRWLLSLSLFVLLPLWGQTAHQPLPHFETLELSSNFFCEGANVADLDRDGQNDIIAGPFWFRGPSFEDRRELYPPKAFDPKNYSDNFFAFVHDFSKDSWPDVLIVGFPGKNADWLENPGTSGGTWRRHLVFEGIDNESPAFEDIDGDGTPELIAMHGGALGFIAPTEDPRATWRFNPISEGNLGGAFTHGLGVGDLTGDGKKDLLWKKGVFEQPKTLKAGEVWRHHAFEFSAAGGAQMLVHDVNGDGRQDVITSLHAHGYGLAWFENQTFGDEGLSFQQHEIMGDATRYPAKDACIGNLHALALADMDGDGLQDFVTGNRYWAHSGRDTSDQDPPEIAWFRLIRKDGAASFERHTIHLNSGVGTQVVVHDATGDGRPDVVVGNKKGIWLHRQRLGSVEGDGVLPKASDGRFLNLDFEAGDLRDWKATGRAFLAQPIRGDTVQPRRADMKSEHQGQCWIGTFEVEKSDRSTGTLSSEPFVVSYPYASFLVGGGAGFDVGVDLIRSDNGAVIFSARGRDEENMHRVVVDLNDHQGVSVFLRIVDAAGGHWGHINFDDFRFHAKKPEFPKKAGGNFAQSTGYLAPIAAKRMSVPEGFHVDVIAAEPDLHQPIAFCFDGQGRIWVAEAHAYPIRKKEGEGRDRIVVFDDKDKDGSFESSTVFADRLNLVSGLLVGFGGVFVGAAPELLFIPDANRDLVPDGPPEVLLDGFGYQDTHETLNSFVHGPDGWIYGCHGVFTHSRVGKPGARDEERVPMNAAVWRYHPIQKTFEIFAEGTSNPWGVDFNADGEAFITACVIPHLYHMIPGGRFERQAGQHFNPYTFDDIKTIADHRHYVGATPHGGNGVSGEVGGGHAHCGAMIYLSDAFPETWRGRIFMSNIHGNRLNTDILERKGTGYVGKHGEDFLRSNDQWFRAISMKTGPDGQLYFIDWYDRQACHRTVPEIWDRSNGRLYRVRYGATKGVKVDVDRATRDELLAAEFGGNEWLAREARRVLQERGKDPELAQKIRASFKETKDPIHRLRLAWSMNLIDGMDSEFLHTMLEDPDPALRSWAIRLSPKTPMTENALAAVMETCAKKETDPSVLLSLAAVVPHLSKKTGLGIINTLAGQKDLSKDHNLPLMLWYGLSKHAEKDALAASDLLSELKLPLLRRYLARQFARMGSESRDILLGALQKETNDSLRAEILLEILDAHAKGGEIKRIPEWLKALDGFKDSKHADLRIRSLRLLARLGNQNAIAILERLAKSSSEPLDKRKEALQELERIESHDLAGVLGMLVQDAELRSAALKASARIENLELTASILKRFSGFSAEEQELALTSLASRTSSAKELLRAISRSEVSKAVLDSAILRRQLSRMNDLELGALMKELWGEVRPRSADRQKVIEEAKKKWSEANLAGADLPRGRAVFARTCMSCHELYGIGRKVGPDLTGSNRRDLDYLLSNILDPSSEVAREYRVTTLWMEDGRILDGIVTSEEAEALTIQLATETVLVRKAEIAREADGSFSRKDSALSMMPEDQLDSLKPDEIRDLLGYLRSEHQVPMRADKSNVSRFIENGTLRYFDFDPKVFRVQDGEIIGQASKLKKNSFLKSHLLLKDFRLIVEVHLEHGVGNSGIQFRSEVLNDGDVRGYQADIGEGYWGDLYEEHGRGLLVAGNPRPSAKDGQWLEYEIVAVGDRILIALSGRKMVDLVDPTGRKEGILAFQVHSGDSTHVCFRNLRLELDPPCELRTLR